MAHDDVPGPSGQGSAHEPDGPSLVDQLNEEHRRNPAAADAPPPDQSPSGPAFAAEPAEDEPKKSGVLGALSAFFAPAPKKGEKPKNAAQRKRAADQARRTQRFGIRYGGDRRRWFTLQALVVGFFALSLISFLVAVQKPNREEIRAEVQAQLADSGTGFPTGEAVMWAGQVLRVWGTWDQASPETREVLISAYLTSGMDSQAGWNGKGVQQVMYASINPEPKVLDAHHAIVQGTYQDQDGIWRCVSIPLYAYKPKEFTGDAPWAFALANNPTPSACSPRTGAPALGEATVPDGMLADEELGQQLATSFFPGFFAAWGASDADALAQYTAAGVTTMGLGGAVESVPPPTIGTTTIMVPRETGARDGDVYQATTQVTWTVSGSASQVTSTYHVDMRKQGDRWYAVSEPAAAPQSEEATGGRPGTVPAPGDGGATAGNYPTDQPSPTSPPASVNPSDGSSEPARVKPTDQTTDEATSGDKTDSEKDKDKSESDDKSEDKKSDDNKKSDGDKKKSDDKG
jgi:hypothetical protein